MLIYEISDEDLNSASEAEQVAAVKSRPLAIMSIANPTEAVQLAAVRSDPSVIKWIKKPASKKVILTVIQKLIKNPIPKSWPGGNTLNQTINKYKKKYPNWLEWNEIDKLTGYVDLNAVSEEDQLKAIQKLPSDIKKISNPSEKLQLAAVTKTSGVIRFIKNPTEQVKLLAVSDNGGTIQYMKNPSEELQLAAVTNRGNAIHYIKNPSEQVQLAAVKQNGLALGSIENPANKTVILTGILKMLKDKDFKLHNWDYSISLYTRYKKQYPDWPEWAVIDKSLQAQKRLK